MTMTPNFPNGGYVQMEPGSQYFYTTSGSASITASGESGEFYIFNGSEVTVYFAISDPFWGNSNTSIASGEGWVGPGGPQNRVIGVSWNT